MRLLSEKRARELSFRWHGGMWSGLYSFASSGSLVAAQKAIDELSVCYNWSEVKCDTKGNRYTAYRHNVKDRKELKSLMNYLENKLKTS